MDLTCRIWTCCRTVSWSWSQMWPVLKFFIVRPCLKLLSGGLSQLPPVFYLCFSTSLGNSLASIPLTYVAFALQSWEERSPYWSVGSFQNWLIGSFCFILPFGRDWKPLPISWKYPPRIFTGCHETPITTTVTSTITVDNLVVLPRPYWFLFLPGPCQLFLTLPCWTVLGLQTWLLQCSQLPLLLPL